MKYIIFLLQNILYQIGNISRYQDYSVEYAQLNFNLYGHA